jgi:DNA-binding PadR family transcriptional regulator
MPEKLVASGMRPALTSAMFHILLALADGERHGYGIMLDVAAYTEGGLRLGAGTLYRSLKHLLDAGLIAEAGERPDPALDDERRRYYRLTEAGQRAAQDEVARLAQLVAVARVRALWGQRAAHAEVGG